MKLKYKILLSSSVLMVLLALVILYTSSDYSESVILDLNTDIMEEQINLAMSEIEGAHGDLELSGLTQDRESVELVQEQVIKEINQIPLKEGAYFYIMDKDLKIVTHAVLKKGDDVGQYDFNQKQANQKIGTMRYVYKGDQKLSVFNSFEPWGWTIVLTNQSSNLLSEHSSFIFYMIIISLIVLAISIAIGYFISNTISKPIVQASDMMNELNKGNLDKRLDYESSDEVGELSGAMNQVADTLVKLNNEITDLTDAATNGNLEKRANANRFDGGYRHIVEGMNNTIDALVEPMKVSSDYVEKISSGEIPPKIKEEYKGDFNTIKSSLNILIDTFTSFTESLQMMNKEQLEGNIDHYISAESFKGVYKSMAEGVNSAVKMQHDDILDILAVVKKFGEGDFSAELREFPGKKRVANEDINKIKANLQAVIDQVLVLVHEAVEGNLAARGDAEKFSGSFHQVVGGINNILDGVVNPLNVAASYVDDISNGIIPEEITTEAKGDFRTLKNNLNKLIRTLSNFTSQMDAMYEEQKKGDIEYYMNAEQYEGIYKNMAEGFNAAVKMQHDDVLEILAMVNRYGEGDFSEDLRELPGKKKVANEFIAKIKSNLQAVIAEVNDLSNAVAEGDLTKRGDTRQFKGSFGELIGGLNKMMNAAEKPINDMYRILRLITVNDYTQKVTEDYTGKWNDLKVAINEVMDRLENVLSISKNVGNGDLSDLDDLRSTPQRSEKDELRPAFINMMESIETLIYDIVGIADAADSGDLSKRIDVMQHKGAYQEVAAGINELVEMLIKPIHVSSDFLEKIATGQKLSKIEEEYKGDYNVIKVNINTVVDTLNHLVEDTLELANSAVDGNLDNRADTSKYQNTWKEIVDGVNDMLDAIVNPLRNTMQTLSEMANGNFDTLMQGNYQGEFLDLKTAINKVIDATNETLNRVNTLSREVLEQSSQVADSSSALSQGATEQAASLEEISSSMNEISSQTKMNADNAKEAEKLAIQTTDTTKKTDAEMQNLTAAMSEINESSKNISQIIKVIDEIAFQTNLLALNAAVEAARAGRHGKGFAVVAEEVRNLAARSAKAAKETSDMIENAIKRSEVGFEIVNNTASLLEEVRGLSEQTSTIIAEISSASNEQAQGIGQINTGLSQVDKVTQQNTAHAEESASASEELANQSRKLIRMLGAFQLSGQKRIGTGSDSKKKAKSGKQKEIEPSGVKMISPNDVIKLDDDEFGKY